MSVRARVVPPRGRRVESVVSLLASPLLCTQVSVKVLMRVDGISSIQS